MNFPYATAAQLRDDAQAAFGLLGPAALHHRPDATFSHLCVRSASATDFAALQNLAGQIGMVALPDASRGIIWVKLATPLIIAGGTLHFLELTPPKPDAAYPTGPQMLVLTLRGLVEPLKVPSPNRPGWVLRFQSQSAVDLSGLS